MACCSARSSATVLPPVPNTPWSFQRESAFAGQSSQMSDADDRQQEAEGQAQLLAVPLRADRYEATIAEASQR